MCGFEVFCSCLDKASRPRITRVLHLVPNILTQRSDFISTDRDGPWRRCSVMSQKKWYQVRSTVSWQAASSVQRSTVSLTEPLETSFNPLPSKPEIERHSNFGILWTVYLWRCTLHIIIYYYCVCIYIYSMLLYAFYYYYHHSYGYFHIYSG